MAATRRDFIAGTGAAIAAMTNLGACAKREAPAAATATAADVESALARVAEDLLADYPENATSLGIDTGARAALKARLSDRSAAGQAAIAKRVRERLTRLKAIDDSGLDDAARIDLDVVRTAHETAAEGVAFPYGEVALLNSNWSWRNAPYVVAQNTGAFLEIPSLLEEQHTIGSREDIPPGAQNWQGDISEVLIYDRELAGDDLQAAGSYLSTKYALSTTFPPRKSPPAPAEADSADDREIVADLYYSALARPPSEQELKTALGHVATADDRREAFEDLFWAVLNSKEFLFQH